MGLGTEIPLLVALGFVVLGPKRMQVILKQIARVKAEFETSSRDIKSRLTAEIDGDASVRK